MLLVTLRLLLGLLLFLLIWLYIAVGLTPWSSHHVYALQETTSAIVAALQSLAPDRKLNESFMAIVRDGTGKTFELDHNRRWLEVTRPIVEAFNRLSPRSKGLVGLWVGNNSGGDFANLNIRPK